MQFDGFDAQKWPVGAFAHDPAWQAENSSMSRRQVTLALADAELGSQRWAGGCRIAKAKQRVVGEVSTQVKNVSHGKGRGDLIKCKECTLCMFCTLCTGMDRKLAERIRSQVIYGKSFTAILDRRKWRDSH